MNTYFLVSVIMVAFVLVAGFGLLMLMMSHTGHNMDCPFAPGGTAVCAAFLIHLKH